MKSNIQLQGLVQELKKTAIQENVRLWKRIARDLEKPTRQRRIVNIHKLSHHTKENEIVVVPGKVLGNGELNHKITIAAFDYSKQAIEKLRNSKSEIYSIFDFMKKNPKGKGVRIIG